MAFRPDSGEVLSQLAETLLRGPSPIAAAERELIAAAVSRSNECRFCEYSHGAAANALSEDDDFVGRSLGDTDHLTPKMGYFVRVARLVARSGREVNSSVVDEGRALGVTDAELHDTVLIAAAFSMYNRYVDGLAAITPEDPADYREMGQMLATQGYVRP